MLPALTLRALQSTAVGRSTAPSTLIALSRYSQMTLVSTVIGSPRSTARNFRRLWTGGSTLKFSRPLNLKSHKSAKFPTDPRRTARGGFAQRSWKNLCAQLSPSHKNIRVNRTGCSSLALKDICEWMGWKVLVLHWTCDPIHHSPSWFHCLHLLVATRTVSRGRS